MNRYITSMMRSTTLFMLTKLMSQLKVTYVVGSFAAFFSLTSIMVPLSGLWGGVGGSSMNLLLGLLEHLAMHGFSFSFHVLVYHIPGFFAALYLTTHNAALRIIVPVACIAFFLMHPQGAQVWFYTAFWLIPIAIAFSQTHILFLQALGSTFTAHAVGTVLWIYMVPMTPALWISLMPIVVLERITYALGITVVHRVAVYLMQKINSSSILTRFIGVLTA